MGGEKKVHWAIFGLVVVWNQNCWWILPPPGAAARQALPQLMLHTKPDGCVAGGGTNQN